MAGYRQIGIREKALSINLDPRIYGSFAEIGAGQEVSAISSQRVVLLAPLP